MRAEYNKQNVQMWYALVEIIMLNKVWAPRFNILQLTADKYINSNIYFV